MTSDQQFLQRANECLAKLLTALDGFDPDELEADLTGGVLRISIAGGGNCILNRQAAANQIWMAEGATAWHFAQDAAGRWLDTKGRGSLTDNLEAVLSRRLGRPIRLDGAG